MLILILNSNDFFVESKMYHLVLQFRNCHCEAQVQFHITVRGWNDVKMNPVYMDTATKQCLKGLYSVLCNVAKNCFTFLSCHKKRHRWPERHPWQREVMVSSNACHAVIQSQQIKQKNLTGFKRPPNPQCKHPLCLLHRAIIILKELFINPLSPGKPSNL